MTERDADREPVVDTETPAAADAAAGAAADTEDTVDELLTLSSELEKASTELGYAKAEIANIRRNALVRIDQAVAAERASVVGKFLDVVDDLDRARAHGDLESGPLKALSDKLAGVLDGLGLAAFGEEGDTFSPELHEAVQVEGDGDNPVLGTVLRKGYRLGERILRTAMVTVTDGAPAPNEAAE
ncbi:nucleotide exchange factor GrpE [Rhodococcus maanshanensis]|uniref:Protein GrpE n=1 Tax=Rhodococcus maanshanensis TaxID=183556 RepID=A0A1H7RD26_9NOCA|nr:nucleotide exchange factor GrpE [Rhodococcus maanshanensis]SEL58093.1 molecular chaperone GrpE [Rhodococcus maanshanensis]